jgi:hypothetical protein
MQISKSLIFVSFLQHIPFLLISSLFGYIKHDIFGLDYKLVTQKVRASEDPSVKQIAEEINFIIENQRGFNFSTLKDRLVGEEATYEEFKGALARELEPLRAAAQGALPQFLELAHRGVTEIAEGSSIETVVASIIEGLSSNPERTGVLLNFVQLVSGANINRQGANLIVYDVLGNGSSSVKGAFSNSAENAEENGIRHLVGVKALHLYIAGSKREEPIPMFFSQPTRDAIGTLRQELSQDDQLNGTYERILQGIDTTLENEEAAQFFAFGEDVDGDLLRRLKGLALGEVTSSFGTACCTIAANAFSLRSKLLKHITHSGVRCPADIVLEYEGTLAMVQKLSAGSSTESK